MCKFSTVLFGHYQTVADKAKVFWKDDWYVPPHNPDTFSNT